jgi:hypothetical protein
MKIGQVSAPFENSIQYSFALISFVTMDSVVFVRDIGGINCVMRKYIKIIQE